VTRSAATDPTVSDGSGDLDHPLPLNLDFMFGKGFLWTEQVPLSDWLTLESLRMEIPDLTFPFDAGGGVDRFQNTRCQVREIEVSVDESGLAARLDEAVETSNEFHDVRVQFLEDAVHVSLQLRAFGSETHLSFRTALLPPEPPRADEVHLSMYDYRWFGPLPYPGRLLAFEWLTAILDHPLFSAPGEGRPFQVGVAGDIASFRPFKLLLLSLFPASGWKLPNLAGVVLDDIHVRPGELVIRATSRESRWETDTEPLSQLRNSREGRRALAAYESKDLFAPADEALFGGHLGQALEMLSNYREKYGLQPQLASRILDCLLADPTAGHLAEAGAITDELLDDNPDDLRAHLARPIIAQIDDGDGAALDDYDELSSVLRRRDDTADWVLAELAAADVLEDRHPREAADRLRTVLKATPHNLPVLERLRSLYRRLGDREEIEDVLKRLTGVYTNRRELRETYLDLARHLMHREGELAEARHYLQKALKIDAENLEALEALGESYALSDQSMRAVKAFSSAARIAESRDELPRARQLQFRIAELWESELDDPEQALLSVRRAISTTESELDAAISLDRPQAIEFARQLEFAAQLCERLDRPEEAIGHWAEAVSLLQRLVDADDVPSRAVGHVDSPDPDSPLGRLATAHRHLAALYIDRGRDSAAESHWRRVLEMDPSADEIVDELEAYYKRAGRAEKLLELLETQLRTATDSGRKVDLHRKLADVHRALGNDDRADLHERRAGEFADNDRDIDDEDVWRHRVETQSIAGTVPEEGDPRGEEGQPSSEAREPGPADDDSTSPAPSPEDHEPTARSGEPGPEPRDPSRGDRNAGAESRDSNADGGDDDEPSIRERLDSSDSFELPSLDIDPESSGFGRTGEEDPESRDPTRQLANPAGESDDEETPDDPELESFRSHYRDLLTGDEGEDEEPDETEDPFADVEIDKPDSTDQSPDAAAETVKADVAPSSADRIDQARSTGDDERLAEVISEVLEARDRSEHASDISDDRALELRRELAELYYYDLEDAEAARPHLERLRDRDPDGRGSAPPVLRALESIYERAGETDGRIAILERQLEAAESDDEATPYRMLLAQLYWQDKRDRDRAETLLERTLETDPDHEGAHRLWARICKSAGDYRRATDHLSSALEVAGDGLDALELERELAELTLDHLEDPATAVDHFTAVLDQAPGDSRALEGRKAAQRQIGDWPGYLDSLRRELAVELGESGDLRIDDLAPDIPGEGIRMTASQIVAEAADIAREQLEEPERARRWFGKAHAIWEQNLEALERRIDLDRSLDRREALADDLAHYADGLLDATARFEALREAARIRDELGDRSRARTLLERAIDAGSDAVPPPEGLDQARRTLDEVTDDDRQH